MARWRITRGLVAAFALSVLCQIVAAWWIVGNLGGLVARIASPYNDAWYMLAINVPAAILWFWYFARPNQSRGGSV